MSKTIWIINDYAGSPHHGMTYRHYYLAKEWIKKGYKVYIITASYSHFLRKFPNVNKNFKIEKIDGINYVWVKVPKYNNSWDKKRVVKWFVFSFKLLFLPFLKIDKPDVIIASPTAPFFVLPAYKLAKKFKSKFIFEIRDIWPLTLVELGNFSANHPFIKFMGWFEKFGVKKSDYIVSTLQNYGEHLKNNLKINKNFIWINNGVSLEEMSKIEPLDKNTEEKIPKDKFIVGYTGTIGVANAIEYLLKAAELLIGYKDIHFVIVGNGKEKENLQQRYANLNNITFIEPIKKQQVQSILKFFDVCYIGWNKEKIYNYGISPNKLFDYMYSEKPILHSYDGKNDIVKLANCGVTVEPENPKAISNAILKLYNMSEQNRKKLGQNGKKYVLEYFTYDKLAKKYEKLF